VQDASAACDSAQVLALTPPITHCCYRNGNMDKQGAGSDLLATANSATNHVQQARAAELLASRDRARRQAEAQRHTWAAERTALKSAAAGLQVRSQYHVGVLECH
jgi:hypothetical protein